MRRACACMRALRHGVGRGSLTRESVRRVVHSTFPSFSEMWSAQPTVYSNFAPDICRSASKRQEVFSLVGARDVICRMSWEFALGGARLVRVTDTINIRCG